MLKRVCTDFHRSQHKLTVEGGYRGPSWAHPFDDHATLVGHFLYRTAMQKEGRALASIRALQAIEIRLLHHRNPEHTASVLADMERSKAQKSRRYSLEDSTIQLASLPPSLCPPFPSVRFYCESGECFIIPPPDSHSLWMAEKSDIEKATRVFISPLASTAAISSAARCQMDRVSVLRQEESSDESGLDSVGGSVTSVSPSLSMGEPFDQDYVVPGMGYTDGGRPPIYPEPAQEPYRFPPISHWEALQDSHSAQTRQDVPLVHADHVTVPVSAPRELPFIFTGGNQGQDAYNQMSGHTTANHRHHNAHTVQNAYHAPYYQHQDDIVQADQSPIPDFYDQQYWNGASYQATTHVQSPAAGNVSVSGVVPPPTYHSPVHPQVDGVPPQLFDTRYDDGSEHQEPDYDNNVLMLDWSTAASSSSSSQISYQGGQPQTYLIPQVSQFSNWNLNEQYASGHEDVHNWGY